MGILKRPYATFIYLPDVFCVDVTRRGILKYIFRYPRDRFFLGFTRELFVTRGVQYYYKPWLDIIQFGCITTDIVRGMDVVQFIGVGHIAKAITTPPHPWEWHFWCVY